MPQTDNDDHLVTFASPLDPLGLLTLEEKANLAFASLREEEAARPRRRRRSVQSSVRAGQRARANTPVRYEVVAPMTAQQIRAAARAEAEAARARPAASALDRALGDGTVEARRAAATPSRLSPVACSTCGEGGFTTASSLQVHVDSVHTRGATARREARQAALATNGAIILQPSQEDIDRVGGVSADVRRQLRVAVELNRCIQHSCENTATFRITANDEWGWPVGTPICEYHVVEWSRTNSAEFVCERVPVDEPEWSEEDRTFEGGVRRLPTRSNAAGLCVNGQSPGSQSHSPVAATWQVSFQPSPQQWPIGTLMCNECRYECEQMGMAFQPWPDAPLPRICADDRCDRELRPEQETHCGFHTYTCRRGGCPVVTHTLDAATTHRQAHERISSRRPVRRRRSLALDHRQRQEPFVPNMEAGRPYGVSDARGQRQLFRLRRTQRGRTAGTRIVERRTSTGTWRRVGALNATGHYVGDYTNLISLISVNPTAALQRFNRWYPIGMAR